MYRYIYIYKYRIISIDTYICIDLYIKSYE